MLNRAIPSTGETVPAIGLGTYSAFDIHPSGLTWGAARDGLKAFVENGGRVVDSSPMYRAAEQAIGALAAEIGVTDKIFVATKVWTTGREAGRAQMEDSFRKLRVSRIDLMQVHNLLDVDVHLRTLAEWKAEGRIRYVGVTHYTASAYDSLEAVMARHDLDFIQINYSASEPEAARRILPLAATRGMAVLANRPLAGGNLIARLAKTPLPGWAGDIGCKNWSQLLLKFCIAHPAVTCAIPGTHKSAHVRDNIAAGTGPLPSESQQAQIRQTVKQL